jgi:phage/plasmid-like protein (TIGR03299 family)
MSHAIEIDSTTGIAAFVAAREEAWHRLGDFQADRLLTVAEAGDRAHLTGWDVRGVPSGGLLDPTDPLSWTPVESKVRPVRTSPFNGQPEFLGKDEVGDGFAFFQNEETLEFAAEVAGMFGDEECVSAAGSIMGGTRVFVTLALEGFTILGQDAHGQWLSAMNGHDGSQALTAWTGATRAVCKNTIDWGLAATTNKVKVRHSGDIQAKASEAAKVLEVARNWEVAYGEFAERLAAVKIGNQAFEKIIRREFVPEAKATDSVRTKNRLDRDFETIVANFRTSPTTEVGRGTRWGALNAITEWAEWGRPGDLTTDKAAELNLFGTPATIRAKAVKVLTS